MSKFVLRFTAIFNKALGLNDICDLQKRLYQEVFNVKTHHYFSINGQHLCKHEYSVSLLKCLM